MLLPVAVDQRASARVRQAEETQLRPRVQFRVRQPGCQSRVEHYSVSRARTACVVRLRLKSRPPSADDSGRAGGPRVPGLSEVSCDVDSFEPAIRAVVLRTERLTPVDGAEVVNEEHLARPQGYLRAVGVERVNQIVQSPLRSVV